MDTEMDRMSILYYDCLTLLISEVEGVMGKPAARFMEDRMIGIFRGKLGGAAAKGGPLLHTLIDEVDAMSVLTFHPVE